jgi:hypothetical protein
LISVCDILIDYPSYVKVKFIALNYASGPEDGRENACIAPSFLTSAINGEE